MENTNNSSFKVTSEIENYLKPFQKKKICLIIEAIEKNFIVVTDRYGCVTSPNWENSFDVYQHIIKLIVESLFSQCDGNGFPNARRFVAIYMNEKPNANIEKMALYFLYKKLNLFDDERNNINN